MYHSKKKSNNKRQHLHVSPKNFSPFDMMDTRYLEHLHHQAKIRKLARHTSDEIKRL